MIKIKEYGELKVKIVSKSLDTLKDRGFNNKL